MILGMVLFFIYISEIIFIKQADQKFICPVYILYILFIIQSQKGKWRVLPNNLSSKVYYQWTISIRNITPGHLTCSAWVSVTSDKMWLAARQVLSWDLYRKLDSWPRRTLSRLLIVPRLTLFALKSQCLSLGKSLKSSRSILWPYESPAKGRTEDLTIGLVTEKEFCIWEVLQLYWQVAKT